MHTWRYVSWTLTSVKLIWTWIWQEPTLNDLSHSGSLFKSAVWGKADETNVRIRKVSHRVGGNLKRILLLGGCCFWHRGEWRTGPFAHTHLCLWVGWLGEKHRFDDDNFKIGSTAGEKGLKVDRLPLKSACLLSRTTMLLWLRQPSANIKTDL